MHLSLVHVDDCIAVLILLTVSLNAPGMDYERVICMLGWLVGTSSVVGGGWGEVVMVRDIGTVQVVVMVLVRGGAPWQGVVMVRGNAPWTVVVMVLLVHIEMVC